ncbi:hypothetical protein ACWHA6_37790 [Streptomyces anthocyanicus]|uniref:hypothetical protein n=1 Tax=Streptomyces TaxID=1883 RepID=UPI0036603773
MTQYDEARLFEARETLAQAVTEIDRQELLAKLCEQGRLAYASLTDDNLGPMLVTYRHRPVGEVYTESPSGLRDWYAQPYGEHGGLGPKRGPFVTARAAAASLIKD